MDISKKKSGSKYLVFDSVNENNEVLKKYARLWHVIRNEIETINDGKKGEHGKDFMKIKFNSDDNLPLNKTLKLYNMTVVIKSFFEEHFLFILFIYLFILQTQIYTIINISYKFKQKICLQVACRKPKYVLSPGTFKHRYHVNEKLLITFV